MHLLALISVILATLFVPLIAYAHCPLCTVGAGVLAVLASSLGISTAAIGVFIGAFAVALGLWADRLIKRKFFPGQKWLLVLGSFLLTVWPLTPLLTSKHGSIYVTWFGDYGSIFNRTYILNWFVIGTLVGAGSLLASPWLSRHLSALRKGIQFPYQGISIAFTVLLIAGLILQLTVR